MSYRLSSLCSFPQTGRSLELDDQKDIQSSVFTQLWSPAETSQAETQYIIAPAYNISVQGFGPLAYILHVFIYYFFFCICTIYMMQPRMLLFSAGVRSFPQKLDFWSRSMQIFSTNSSTQQPASPLTLQKCLSLSDTWQPSESSWAHTVPSHTSIC